MEKIQLIFSFILVIATLVYVYYTHKLVIESRKSREQSTKPRIILYLESAETSPTVQYLVIQNVGQGLAENVRFELIKDLEATTPYDKTLKERKFIERQYNYFPPNYIYKEYVFHLSNDYEHKVNSHIVINCKYTDSQKNKYSETFNLNLDEGFGKSKLTPPSSHIGMISYRIEKLQESIIELIKNNSKT